MKARGRAKTQIVSPTPDVEEIHVKVQQLKTTDFSPCLAFPASFKRKACF
jgi:hypothetical protein